MLSPIKTAILVALLALCSSDGLANDVKVKTWGVKRTTGDTVWVAGVIQASSDSISYYVEYGPDTTDFLRTETRAIVSPAATNYVDEALTGLLISGDYYYRFVCVVDDSIYGGETRQFRNYRADAPVVQTGGISHLGSIKSYRPPGITINGHVNASGTPTTYFFEYGLTQNYGLRTPDGESGATLGASFHVDWASSVLGWDGWGDVTSATDSLLENYLSVLPSNQPDFNHSHGIGLAQPILWSVVGEIDDQVGPPTRVGGGNADFRDAEVSIRLRNRSFVSNGTKLNLWIQSQPGSRDPFRDWIRPNWAFTTVSMVDSLASQWRSLNFVLSNDASQWTYAGNNLFQQNPWRYSYMPLDSCLGNMNYDMVFALRGLVPENLPTGELDFSELNIRYRNKSILFARNGGALMKWPEASTDDPTKLTDGIAFGEDHAWHSEENPTTPQEFIFRFDREVDIRKIKVHQNALWPSRLVEILISQDGISFTQIDGLVLPEAASIADNYAYAFAEHVTPVQARFLKVRIADWYRAEKYGLGEIEVFGDGATMLPGDELFGVNADIHGLQLDSTYHYRLVATNKFGTVYGEDRTFVLRSNPIVFASIVDTAALFDSTYQCQLSSRLASPDSLGGKLRYGMIGGPAWLNLDDNTGFMTGVPKATDLGRHEVRLYSFDDLGRRGEESFFINVDYTKHAPVITSLSDSVAHEDLAYLSRIVASDQDTICGERLFYRKIVGPHWLLVDSASGVLSGTPHSVEVGDTTLTVEVGDGNGGSHERTFTLSVLHTNHAPVFVSAPVDSAKEDSPYSYRAAASDIDSARFGDRVMYRLLHRPSWLQIDSITGVISGTPVWIQARDTVVEIEAHDNQGGVAHQEFFLAVAHVNHLPAVAAFADTLASEDFAYFSEVHATDQDTVFGDVLRYRKIIGPVWLNVDSASGVLSGIPAATDVGRPVVTVEVDDGVGGVGSRSFAVIVAHTNHPPSFVSTPDEVTREDSLYSYQTKIADVDTLFNDTLRVTVQSMPAWMSYDGQTGRLSGTPRAIDVGQSTVVLQADDGKGGTSSQEYPLQVLHTNHSPIISGIADTLGYEDSHFVGRILAVDADSLFGDVLTYHLPVGPAWLEIDTTTGVMSGTPLGINVGDTPLVVEVRDGVGGSALLKKSIRVIHVNHPPLFTSLPDTTVSEDSHFAYQVRAIDADSLLFGDRISFRALVKPVWLSLDADRRSLSGIPTALNVGDTIAVLQAVDDSGAVAEQRFSLRVNHVNHDPQITSEPVSIVAGGALYWYDVIASDRDTLFAERLKYVIMKGPDWLKVESSKGLLSGVAPPTHDDNEFPVVIGVTDQAGATAEQSFVIRLVPGQTEEVEWVYPADENIIGLKIPREPVRFVWPSLFRWGTIRRELQIKGPALDTLILEIGDTTTTLAIMDRLQPHATYQWKVRALRAEDGVVRVDSFYFQTTAIKLGNTELTSSVPQRFFLEQNFPNPFNPNTMIVYGLPEDADVRLEIFNMLGQLVYRRDERQRPGYYDVEWRGTDLSGQKVASGVYVYRLIASGAGSPNSAFVQTRKMILLK